MAGSAGLASRAGQEIGLFKHLLLAHLGHRLPDARESETNSSSPEAYSKILSEQEAAFPFVILVEIAALRPQ